MEWLAPDTCHLPLKAALGARPVDDGVATPGTPACTRNPARAGYIGRRLSIGRENLSKIHHAGAMLADRREDDITIAAPASRYVLHTLANTQSALMRKRVSRFMDALALSHLPPQAA